MLGKYANGVAFFEALISSNNAIRAPAEQDLKALKQTNPSLLFSSCLEGVTSGTTIPVVQMALFIIKKEFVEEKDEVPAETKPQLTATIFKVVETHGARILMNIGAEILCGIASHSKNYQVFLQDLVKICQSTDPKMRMFGLICFETLIGGHLESGVLASFTSSFLAIFSQLLTGPEVSIRTQAVKTISGFLCAIEDRTILLSASEVIKSLVETMVETLKNSEDDGKVALESLTNLTEKEPSIWDKYLSDIFVICSQIITATKFSGQTRSEAIDLILIIAENKKKEVRRLEEMKSQFFPALLQMMTEVDFKDDLAGWIADETDDITKTDAASTAALGMSNLAEALGDKATIALCETHIMGYMKSEDWTKRHAGIHAIGMIVEHCKKIMLQDPVMSSILSYLLNINLIVQYFPSLKMKT